MERLRGGYTNRTSRSDGGRIVKTYEGTDALARLELEHACLTNLTGLLPLPTVIEFDRDTYTLTMLEVPGTHGQDLMNGAQSLDILRQLGSLHSQLTSIDPSTVPQLGGTGKVIVHGDFGPQNTLFDGGVLTALIDWEFAHIGQPLEDLAWTEWIVRMHHPDHRDGLAELFNAAGVEPAWHDRHATMVAGCSSLLGRVQRLGMPTAVDLWKERLSATENWTE